MAIFLERKKNGYLQSIDCQLSSEVYSASALEWYIHEITQITQYDNKAPCMYENTKTIGWSNMYSLTF